MITEARSRGGIASAIVSISAGVAGSTLRLVVAAPAPRMWTGEAAISSSSTAEFMIARSSPYAFVLALGAADASLVCQVRTSVRVIWSIGRSPNVGTRYAASTCS